MSRLSRRNRTWEDLGIRGRGGLMDALDDAVKGGFRINDEEYDYIAGNITEEEMDIVFKDYSTFKERKEAINIIEKYIEQWKKTSIG